MGLRMCLLNEVSFTKSLCAPLLIFFVIIDISVAADLAQELSNNKNIYIKFDEATKDNSWLITFLPVAGFILAFFSVWQVSRFRRNDRKFLQYNELTKDFVKIIQNLESIAKELELIKNDVSLTNRLNIIEVLNTKFVKIIVTDISIFVRIQGRSIHLIKLSEEINLIKEKYYDDILIQFEKISEETVNSNFGDSLDSYDLLFTHLSDLIVKFRNAVDSNAAKI